MGLVLLLLLAPTLAGCAAMAADRPFEVAEQHGPLRLTLTTDHTRLAPGAAANLTYRVENVGDKPVNFTADGCGAAWTIRVVAPGGEEVPAQPPEPGCDEPERPGVLQPGEAVEGATSWDGLVWAGDTPRAADPGAYRVRASFEYVGPSGALRAAEASLMLRVAQP